MGGKGRPYMMGGKIKSTAVSMSGKRHRYGYSIKTSWLGGVGVERPRLADI
jgi:hypothetical protein